MGAENHADWLRAIHDPDTVRAMIEDYRAGLGVDRAADEADRAAGRRVACPTLVLWSGRDDLEELFGDPRLIWAAWTDDLRGGRVIDSGHHGGGGPRRARRRAGRVPDLLRRHPHGEPARVPADRPG
jgi:haloacetate dehalogenase